MWPVLYHQKSHSVMGTSEGKLSFPFYLMKERRLSLMHTCSLSRNLPDSRFCSNVLLWPIEKVLIGVCVKYVFVVKFSYVCVYYYVGFIHGGEEVYRLLCEMSCFFYLHLPADLSLMFDRLSINDGTRV